MKKVIAFIVACLMVSSLVDVNWLLFAENDEESSVETILEEESAVTEGDSEVIENDSESILVEEEILEETIQEEVIEVVEEVPQDEIDNVVNNEETQEIEEQTIDEEEPVVEEESTEPLEVVEEEELPIQEEEEVLIEEIQQEEATTEEEIDLIVEEVVQETVKNEAKATVKKPTEESRASKEKTEEVVKVEETIEKTEAKDLTTKGFVQRLYSLCLNRNGEKSGVNYWVNHLNGKSKTAAEVALGFFHSVEFENKKLNNRDFVLTAYRVFLDREGESSGVNYWTTLLDGGISRDYIIKGFVESTEFTNICNVYKVNRGSIDVKTNYLESNQNLTRFVGRLYKLCLGRTAERSGAEYWVKALATRSKTAAQLVQGFFYSNEFINKKLSNEEFVETAYKTMLDRNGEASGLGYWNIAINSGCSKDFILSGFINSQEFINICNKYGVELGEIKLSEKRDLESSKTKLIGYASYVTKDKVPSVKEVNSLISSLSKGDKLASTLIWEMLNENVFNDKKLTTKEKVRRTALAITGKEPSTDFIGTWVEKIVHGNSYANLVELLTSDTVYRNRCSDAGVDSTPYYATISSVKETTKKISGKALKVLVDSKGNIIKNSLRVNGYYYQIDSVTGEIIHKQKLMNDKVYMEGIDVSVHNASCSKYDKYGVCLAWKPFDFSKYEDGFVIVRAGYGWGEDQIDPVFKQHVEECIKRKIPFGVYWYSYATNVEQSKLEAELFAKTIAPYKDKITLGVWLDQEEATYRIKNGTPINKKTITALTKAFLKVLDDKGYHAGIYASYSWFQDYIDVPGYDRWVAHYKYNDGTWAIDLSGNALNVIHQYTSKPLDKNVMYRDPNLLMY